MNHKTCVIDLILFDIYIVLRCMLFQVCHDALVHSVECHLVWYYIVVYIIVAVPCLTLYIGALEGSDVSFDGRHSLEIHRSTAVGNTVSAC